MTALAGCNTASLQNAAPKATDLPPPTFSNKTGQPLTVSGTIANSAGSATHNATARQPAGTAGSARERRHSSVETTKGPASSSSGKQQSRGTATEDAPFVASGAAESKTYPKFVPPKAATSQMTPQEQKAFEQQMAARMKANAPKNETPAEYAERMKLMRALANQHGEDTLKQIEN